MEGYTRVVRKFWACRFMEEQSRKSRLIKRFTLAAWIAATASPLSAKSPDAKSPDTSEAVVAAENVVSLRSLLSNGPGPQPETIAVPVAPPTPSPKVSSPKRRETSPVAQATPKSIKTPTRPVASIGTPIPSVSDIRLRLIDVAKSLTIDPASSTDTPDPAKQVGDEPAATPESIAEILKGKASVLVLPQRTPLKTSSNPAPYVKRSTPSNSLTSMIPSAATDQPNREYKRQDDQDDIAMTKKTAATTAAAGAVDTHPIAMAPPIELPKPTTTELLESESIELRAELDAKFAKQHLFPSVESDPAVTASASPVPMNDSMASSQLLPPPVTSTDQETTSVSPTAMIHANRLRELSHRSLQAAKDCLQRGALHSARKYATESLRQTIDMQDIRDGGNRHARHLDLALSAIRESDDFCGRFGHVDSESLQRMVSVHETDVLKEHDLSNVSAMRASEAYLSVAKDNLVAAAGDSSDACDAMVLLGILEKQLQDKNPTHAGAVAITLQHAASEIAPNSALARQELGVTFLEQGLVPQAAFALSQSIQLRPSRVSYTRLLDASRRMGDAETSGQCLQALNDPSLPSGIAVKTLTPEDFAASYRPDPVSMQAPSKKAAASPPSQADTPRVSTRSFFPFGRR
ncbi:hypothetical protein Poly51_26700 [Rubripirellula tenax]|uniref:Tetratricopeptide repeat protein n=1 Tax=Rubripirellula tenax TaxID=2528015 RepID=A0A5C6F4T0_9BACT|nr:hypothetical protein [Rubripirellula tenax]TWU56753.1 hypothetical protein Poly51_26700 [Rubripirellula tenax]